MPDYEPNAVLSNTSYKVLGTRPVRHDGVEKVTGHARYGADIAMPDLLYGKVLRSSHAHARIKRIDASKALALPGVKAVATSADLYEVSDRASDVEPGEIRNFGILSANCLARGKALYKGHAVAAVAATSPHAAEEALAAIEVEYEPLPAVFTAEEALADGAPILHERLATLDSPMGPGGMLDDEDEAQPTNVARHFVHELGDPDAGFAEADVIVERRYRTEAVHQGYIEPHSATVYWDKDKTTVWTSTQGHFGIREQLAKIVGVPVSNIKVIPMEIGGGFGGKTIVYVEPVAAVLSRKTGQPVKVTMSRAEVFLGTGPTSGTGITVKIGATNAGRITAATADMVYEGGAFPGSPLASGARCIFAAYDVANLRVDARDVVVNKQKVAAYRAPGAPAAAFAAEQAVDELARALKMDPLELRLANAAREGTRQVTGPKFGAIGCVETLEAAKEHAHYAAPVGGGGTGPEGQAARARRRQWFLGQHRRPLGLRGQREPRRHGEPDRGIPGHRREPSRHRDAARRGARPAGGGRAADRGGHRLDRLHLADRRQQRGLQDRLGRVRGGAGRQATDDRARRPGVGRVARRRGVRRRCAAAQVGP